MATESDEIYAFFSGGAQNACPECGATVEWRTNAAAALRHVVWHENLRAALDALKQYVIATTDLLGVIVDE